MLTNAINYTQGSVAANGLVSIDGFETIEFSNKVTLTINALAGDDKINLNNASTPTGLTTISINGGDPTASDELVVSGTSGNETINYAVSNTVGAGSVTITGAPTVNFTTHRVVSDRWPRWYGQSHGYFADGAPRHGYTWL